MADHELTPDEAIRRLAELFSEEPSAPSRGCRKYVLECQDREPVFRFAEIRSKPALPRDKFDVIFDEVMTELFGPDPNGDEIVPQKLAKLFPGSLKTAYVAACVGALPNAIHGKSWLRSID